MDTPATSWKRPASSLLSAKARQPTASVVSISLPRARRCPTLGNAPHLVPTPHRQWLHAWKGGRNCERNCRIPRLYKPLLRFVLRLRLQKGGVFAGHYGPISTIREPSMVLLQDLVCATGQVQKWHFESRFHVDLAMFANHTWHRVPCKRVQPPLELVLCSKGSSQQYAGK